MHVVDLFETRRGELFDEGGGVGPAVDEPHAREPAADAAQRGEVDLDDLLDAGPQHLDDDIGESEVGGDAGREARAVRLAERSGRDRLGLDAGERAIEWDAQLALDLLDDARERLGGHLILQPLELARDPGRQDVEARR